MSTFYHKVYYTLCESVKKAAETYNVTPSAIVYKCKSKSSKNINWTYV
jgi:hypothetical protein